MKGTLKKMFSDISSTEHKTVPANKVEIETVNFNQYWREQKTYQANKTNPIDKQGKIICSFKCNSAKHFARNCTSFSLRNDINTVVDSDQIHFPLFNFNSHYWMLINNSNIKMFSFVKETFGSVVLDSTCLWTVAGEI